MTDKTIPPTNANHPQTINDTDGHMFGGFEFFVAAMTSRPNIDTAIIAHGAEQGSGKVTVFLDIVGLNNLKFLIDARINQIETHATNKTESA